MDPVNAKGAFTFKVGDVNCALGLYHHTILEDVLVLSYQSANTKWEVAWMSGQLSEKALNSFGGARDYIRDFLNSINKSLASVVKEDSTEVVNWLSSIAEELNTNMRYIEGEGLVL